MGKIIAVANQKGGVGKTTTAVNLSSCLAYKGKKVLLLDIDPQGNTTSGFGINKNSIKKSIYNVLMEEFPMSDVLMNTPLSSLKLCPSNIQLAGAEVELVSQLSREVRLRLALDPIANQFDFIIIDCPPSLGLLTINALNAAQAILVPVQCEYYALEGLSQLVDTINLVKKHLNPLLKLEGIVLTMFDGRTNLSMQVVDEVRKHFDGKVCETMIPRNVRLSEAPSHGLPAALYDLKSKGSEAYMELADEIIECSEEARV